MFAKANNPYFEPMTSVVGTNAFVIFRERWILSSRRHRIRWSFILAAAILALVGGFLTRRARDQHEPLTAPAPLATWPWPHATITHPYPGVTYWTDRSSPDGTVVRLVEFDFDQRPGLRFAIYDQDQDDSIPNDDTVDYWPMGVAQATSHLNTVGKGVVIAACNGLFFDTDGSLYPPNGAAHHVAATVRNGVVHYNVGNHRWTFGVKYGAHDAPAFALDHMPDRMTLIRDFTFASGGAQCLIHDGKPLALRPFPGPDELPEKQPVPSTPAEVGHIPVVDHIKTSRVSFGWTRDSRRLYLLFIRQGGTEGGSIQAFRMRGMGSHAEARSRMLAQGGWDVADEQRFWEKLGIWDAINSDGGEVAQLALIDPDGRYDVYPARWASPVEEIPDQILGGTPSLHLPSARSLPPLPTGGSLMYFYIYDSSRDAAPAELLPVRQ
jgi:hypothetical protein